MTSSLLSILFVVSPLLSVSFASDDQANVLASVPKKLIKVELVNGKPVIRTGKCCHQEIYREFTHKDKEWFVVGTVGLESVTNKIESVTGSKLEITIRSRDVICTNCSASTFSLARDPKTPYLWKMTGDPFAGAGSSAIYIDSDQKAKAGVKVDDDCPKDGGAC